MPKAVVAQEDVCKQCCQRPCLGALSRCGECVRAAAEVDRQSRIAAETRAGARKRAQEEAEVQADAILARDAQRCSTATKSCCGPGMIPSTWPRLRTTKRTAHKSPT